MTSPDLQHWTRLEDVTGDKRREAWVNLYWKNKFWLFVDEWRDLGVYQSDDGIRGVSNSLILDRTAGKHRYQDRSPATQSLRLSRHRVLQTQDLRLVRNPLRMGTVSHHEKYAPTG